MKDQSIIIRFWAKVTKTKNCWHWVGCRNTFGYGNFRVNRSIQKAHRISWAIHKGKIPDGMCVLHSCDVPYCVNPKHLFLGTYADNAKDMSKKGRCWLQNDPIAAKRISSIGGKSKAKKFYGKGI